MKGDLKAAVSIAIYSADSLSVLQITIPSFFPTSPHLDKPFFFFSRQLSVSLSFLQAFFVTWSVWKYKPSPGMLALVVFPVPPLPVWLSAQKDSALSVSQGIKDHPFIDFSILTEDNGKLNLSFTK